MTSPHNAKARAFAAPWPANSDPVDGIANNTKRCRLRILRTRFMSRRKTEKRRGGDLGARRQHVGAGWLA